MRKIRTAEITEEVKNLCKEANYCLSKDVYKKIKEAQENEESFIAKDILNKLILNAEIAEKKQMPICQDTGMAVFFVEIGQDIIVTGGNITDAINEGVRRGYIEGYLRKSVVKDPIQRVNTEDNTPAIIHYDVVKGDKLKINFAPKGFGSENMSQIKMLKPSDGIKGIEEFILEVVKEAGPNPCPPIVVGVGIGGTFEKAALLAKKSLFREIGSYNSENHIRELEKNILEKINNLGIGPQGLGGKTTALALNIEIYPTHIAGLPVAVNLNCHVARHRQIIL